MFWFGASFEQKGKKRSACIAAPLLLRLHYSMLMLPPEIFLLLLLNAICWQYKISGVFSYTLWKNWNCWSKNKDQDWARVIWIFFNRLFSYLNLILETWNQKLTQNTWSIEAKLFHGKFEIHGHFKVRFLRQNAKMNWTRIFRLLCLK